MSSSPNKKRSRFFFYITAVFALAGVIVMLFFRHDYNSDPDASIRIHIWSPLTLILWAFGFIAFVAAVLYIPDFEPNTKKVFSANTTEFSVELSSPLDYMLTVRWADIKKTEWSPDRKWMNLELADDFFDHEDDTPINVVMISDICLNQQTPGFELLMEFMPGRLKTGSPRSITGKWKKNKKKRKKKK